MSVKQIQRHSASTGPGSPDVTGLYDPDTGSIQYIVACPETKKAAIIDAVQDYDLRAARLTLPNAGRLDQEIKDQGLDVAWVLDTHPHADHVTASAWLKDRFNAPNAIGEKTRDIAKLWQGFYHLPDLDPDAHYDRLWADGDSFEIGNLKAEVTLSPGHTLGSITYKIGDAAFIHDTLMHTDAGSSRCDFPGGSAEDLWNSIQTILAMPDETRLFVGHDYCAGGREPMWESTVADQRANNTHIGGGVTREAFLDLRTKRDATLKLPDRMLVALQLNLRAGRVPDPEADGNSYLKIPLNRF
jgi:glyoxylase-like metal-dependent hydrolase (beta-lactamase superfamily II)